MKNWMAGVGLLSLCALCCAFPFLTIGSAGAAGILGFSISPWITVGILTVGAAVLLYRKNQKKPVCNADGNCGCK